MNPATSNEGITQFDRRLEELEVELKDLNEKYAFEGKTQPEAEECPGTPEPEKLTIRPAEAATVPLPPPTGSATRSGSKKDPRYSCLTRVDIKKEEVVPRIVLRPQISEKWTAELKAAPRIEDLYDRAVYEPECCDLAAIKVPARLVGDELGLLSREIDIQTDEYAN